MLRARDQGVAAGDVPLEISVTAVQRPQHFRVQFGEIILVPSVRVHEKAGKILDHFRICRDRDPPAVLFMEVSGLKSAKLK